MIWKKRDEATTVKEVVLRNTGLPEEYLTNPPTQYHIEGLDKAMDAIRNAILSNIKITVYGDYDCDGVTASAILYRLLMHLGAHDVTVRLPRRFSEGYGLSLKGLADINDGLLITVDNGIAAVDEIKIAKEKGLQIVVLDHHLRREDGVLPEADVVVDPNAIEGSDFNGYCGAGLVFKLAQLMVDDQDFLNKMSGLAAIGTVTDVMALIMDNRNIVAQGLQNINAGNNVPGLSKLIELLGLYDINEDDIGFKFGPIINACGRMDDDGASIAWKLLTTDDWYEAKRLADTMILTNETRKVTVENCMEACEQIMSEDCLYSDNPLVVYADKNSRHKLHEGVVGIIAGKLAEAYKRPAIVLTETEDGILKGSGRSYGTLNLKALLDTVADKLAGYGGHAGAAGIRVELDKVEDMKIALQDNLESFPDYSPSEVEEVLYDLEIPASDIAHTMDELRKYAPYGEGNPKPVFVVKNIRLSPRAGKFFRVMGAKGQHLKLFGNGFDIVAFDKAEEFENLGNPMVINVLGTISENRFGGNTILQLETIELDKCKEQRNPTSLAGRLAEQMRNKGFAEKK